MLTTYNTLKNLPNCRYHFYVMNAYLIHRFNRCAAETSVNILIDILFSLLCLIPPIDTQTHGCFLQCQRWIPIYGNHFRIDTIDVQIARSRRKSSHEDNLLVVFRPNVISAMGNNTFILWLFKHTNII